MIYKTKAAKYKAITKIIQSEINEKVSKIIEVPRRRIYKIISESGKLLRFNFYGPKIEEVRLQRIAYDNGVRVPRVLGYDKNMKISEWIDGVDIHFVRANPEVTKQLGRLIGKLNATQDDENDGKYLTYSDITNRNFIWTKDKKLYVIDFDHMVLVDYDEAIRQAIIGVAARMSKSRWRLFLEGYTQYHPDLDIDKFIKQANERHNYWCKKKKERKN